MNIIPINLVSTNLVCKKINNSRSTNTKCNVKFENQDSVSFKSKYKLENMKWGDCSGTTEDCIKQLRSIAPSSLENNYYKSDKLFQTLSNYMANKSYPNRQMYNLFLALTLPAIENSYPLNKEVHSMLENLIDKCYACEGLDGRGPIYEYEMRISQLEHFLDNISSMINRNKLRDDEVLYKKDFINKAEPYIQVGGNALIFHSLKPNDICIGFAKPSKDEGIQVLIGSDGADFKDEYGKYNRNLAYHLKRYVFNRHDKNHGFISKVELYDNSEDLIYDYRFDPYGYLDKIRTFLLGQNDTGGPSRWN